MTLLPYRGKNLIKNLQLVKNLPTMLETPV